VAGQAAYGVVGRFSKPPIEPGRFVLMDYRCDHLSEEQRSEPPTFLYAMDLGDGVFFVEETSLALAPGVPYDVLKQRLQQRLDLRGVEITEVIHEEFCLFPMNLPLPDRNQPVLALVVRRAWCTRLRATWWDHYCGGGQIWPRPSPKPSPIQALTQRLWRNGVGKRSGRSSWCCAISFISLVWGG
jgi:hypothetical protein